MIRYALGFTIGALFAVALLTWTAPPALVPGPTPAPGWYDSTKILHYAGNYPSSIES